MAQNVCGVTSWCKPKEVPKNLDMTNENKHKNKVKVKVVQDNNDDRYTKARPTTVG